MPTSTHIITALGLEVPVVIGTSAGDMIKRGTGTGGLPRPVRATGLLDTGTDATAISAVLLQRLGITPSRQTSTTTFGV
jgi:hypothetical protein